MTVAMKEIQRAIDALKEVPEEYRALVVTEASGGWKKRGKPGPKPGGGKVKGKPGPKPGTVRGKPGPKPKVKAEEMDAPVKISPEKAAKLKALKAKAGLN